MMPTHLIVGPATHGVTRFALQVAEALAAPVLRCATWHELAERLDEGDLPGRMHLHFTDHLFGDTPAAAARLLERLVEHGTTLSVTLHDVPQPREGEARFQRRAQAYAAIAGFADFLVVNSRHEQHLLAEARIAPASIREAVTNVHVVLLPIMPMLAGPPAAKNPTPMLGIFGFLYPGKGIEAVIDAAALQTERCEVAVLGAVSPGHDWLAQELHERAARLGVPFSITGFLDDAGLPAALAAVDVPIAWHRHLSASGSINSWIGAGRRPIVADSRYAREIDERHEGTILRAEGSLADAIAAALAHPERTRLTPGALEHAWTLADVAASYRRLFEDARVPDAQVIIPFYDDGTESETPGATGTLAEERLRLILAALTSETRTRGPAFGVTVVDDGSPADTRWLRELETPFPLALARQPDLGFRAGAARSLGASTTPARAFVFLDGDTVPQPGYVRAITSEILDDRADLTVGARTHRWLTGPQRGEKLEDPHWLQEAYARTEQLAAADERSYQFVISAVMAVRASTLFALGGFDESLSAYGGEDWEFAWRAWQAGARIAQIPEAVAVHDGPDWAARGGRDDADARAEKNSETLALAPRIAAEWTRPAGVQFAMPELSVDLSALPDAACASAAGIVWLATLLAAHSDVVVRMREIPDVFSADRRISSDPLPWSRWRFQAQGDDAAELPPAETIAATMHELDAAPENGPFGGARRQARFVRIAGNRHSPVGTLRSARAEALAEREAEQASGHDEPTDRALEIALTGPRTDAHPDLESTWAGW